MVLANEIEESASPITNRWGEVRPERLVVEHASVFRGREGQAFNHQAQLSWDGERMYATWSSCARDEEEAGQHVVMAVSDDVGRTWSKADGGGTVTSRSFRTERRRVLGHARRR